MAFGVLTDLGKLEVEEIIESKHSNSQCQFSFTKIRLVDGRIYQLKFSNDRWQVILRPLHSMHPGGVPEDVKTPARGQLTLIHGDNKCTDAASAIK